MFPSLEAGLKADSRNTRDGSSPSEPVDKLADTAMFISALKISIPVRTFLW